MISESFSIIDNHKVMKINNIFDNDGAGLMFMTLFKDLMSSLGSTPILISILIYLVRVDDFPY